PLSAKPGPAYRSAKFKPGAFETGFFADLAAHPGDHVFHPVELAAEAVVLSEMQIVGLRVAVDEEDALPIGGEHVAERGQNWGVGHGQAVGVSRHSARIFFTNSTSPSSIPSRRERRRSRDSSRSSHISREGLAHFSQTPRRSRRQENVHRPAKRSARTNRRLPVFGSVSSHLISIVAFPLGARASRPHSPLRAGRPRSQRRPLAA